MIYDINSCAILYLKQVYSGIPDSRLFIFNLVNERELAVRLSAEYTGIEDYAFKIIQDELWTQRAIDFNLEMAKKYPYLQIEVLSLLKPWCTALVSKCG